LEKARDFTISSQVMVTTDPSNFLNDIDCLVEVAGGCGLAREMMMRALQSGRPVITANKAALFECNTEFLHACRERGARIGMEAAVCGGIPIIQMLHSAYVGDCISSICGICNGTTNYMLSKMEANPTQVLYSDALIEAQNLGYAEADPTADVEGM
jgi:homoserine dehydrogenase